MTYFMRDRESKQRRAVRGRQTSEPLDAIHVDRRQRPLVDPCVYQGVSELQLPMLRRRSRQADEPDGEFCSAERCVARRGRAVSSTRQPRDIDAGGGQDPGRRTQSNRLIRRRHHPVVVHAHGKAGKSDVVFLSNGRSALGRGLGDT